MNRFVQALVLYLAVVASVGFVLWMTLPALPHEARTGWRYPYACCSDRDCREIPGWAVREGPEGYTIAATGELIPYTDRRVKRSPDGVFHWCSVAGKIDGRTICLFVPHRGF